MMTGRGVASARCQKANIFVTEHVSTVAQDVLYRDERRVYIIDDDSDMRKSLFFLLSALSIKAWPFAESADFVEQLPNLSPAPILLDIRMPVIDGLQLLAILRERELNWPVIVMTAHGNVSIAVRAMKLGATEFLEKPFQLELVEETLDRAFETLKENERLLLAREDAMRRIGQLSEREAQVIAILMKGAMNKVAAQQLTLSVRTVEMHRGNALTKLGLRSMAEVVALVATAGLSSHPRWSG